MNSTAQQCFSEKPLRVIKSSRKALTGLCFLEATPAQPGLQSREALGTAQLGSKVMGEGTRRGHIPITEAASASGHNVLGSVGRGRW